MDDAQPSPSLRRRFTRSSELRSDQEEAELQLEACLDAAPVARRIVLTGGPGSGKSTAASFLAREFADDLWVLPEAATLLYRGGLPRGDEHAGISVAQHAIYTVQRSLERAHALQHPGRVQLCDRGTVDGAAYWPGGPDGFFAELGTTRAAELARYDAIIFLHTAAMLPGGYERNLEVRTEDVEEAITLDQRIWELYRDHPQVISIPSQSSFLDKLIIVRKAVNDLVRQKSLSPAEDDAHPTGGVPLSVLAQLGASTTALRSS
jgi:predicted ATPase